MPTKPTPNHRRSKLPLQRPNRWSIPIPKPARQRTFLIKTKSFLREPATSSRLTAKMDLIALTSLATTSTAPPSHRTKFELTTNKLARLKSTLSMLTMPSLQTESKSDSTARTNLTGKHCNRLLPITPPLDMGESKRCNS